ncbi:MAG: DUF58 domain-containing protein, partial [Blastocatellia bacterium]
KSTRSLPLPVPYHFPKIVLSFLRQKKSFRFVLVTAWLTGAAVLSAAIGGVASQMGKYEFAAISSRLALGLAVIVVIYVLPQLFRTVQWRSNYAMQVPNAGLIFGAMILMVTVLALTSGNNLLYVVLAVLLATMIVSIASARMNLWRLKPSVRFPDHIFAGESVPFEITLKSERRLMPSFSLSIDLVEERELANAEPKSVQQQAVALGYFPVVPARSYARSTIERSFDRRGVFPVTGFLINTGFPFGFVEQRRFIQCRSEIIVYPQAQPIEDFADLLPLLTGRIESRAKGMGSDLYAIRPYLASDHHRHIDWKATAKTGQMMVREFTREDDWRVTVIFDSQVDAELATETGFAEKFECAVTFAASLLSHFINLNGEVRLVTNDYDTDFGVGQSHLFRMLRQLAQLAPIAAQEEEFFASDEQTHGFQILITSNREASISSNVYTQAQAVQVISFEELRQEKPGNRQG